MKAEEARRRTDEALANLEEALAAGKSDALEAYLKMAARFHHYSFGNIMLIASQRPDATQVAGFRTWKKLGRYVRKGEKGIVIIAPMLIKNREATSGEDESFLRFRAVYVFDVSQTDGEPLPELATVQGDPAAHTQRLKAFVAEKGISLEYAADLEGADGRSHGGRIQLLAGLSAAEEFSVLAHETAHELLHKDRSPEARLPKVVRETEAEAVAFVVTHATGLDTGTAASDYIQLYQGSAETLAASLDRVQKAAAEILTFLGSPTTADLVEAKAAA